MIYHPHVIKYLISNNYITRKAENGVRGVKTELHQKILLKVSVHELHIDMH